MYLQANRKLGTCFSCSFAATVIVVAGVQQGFNIAVEALVEGTIRLPFNL